MCGRTACTLRAARCKRIAGASAKVRGMENLRPRYNIGPQSHLPVVRSCPKEEIREVCTMQWGLVPTYAKSAEEYDLFKGGSSTFNARSETLESSRLWSRLLDDKRCVILVDGFYEWKASDRNSKTPMFIRHSDGYTEQSIGGEEGSANLGTSKCTERAPLLLAGLYDSWHGGKDMLNEPLFSMTVLTMDPGHTPLELVHDRMPVFLTPETAAVWLDPARKYCDVVKCVLGQAKEHARTQMHVYEVSTLVSNIKNESPDCILSKKEYASRQFAQGIGRFFKKSEAKEGLIEMENDIQEKLKEQPMVKTNEAIEAETVGDAVQDKLKDECTAASEMESNKEPPSKRQCIASNASSAPSVIEIDD